MSKEGSMNMEGPGADQEETPTTDASHVLYAKFEQQLRASEKSGSVSIQLQKERSTEPKETASGIECSHGDNYETHHQSIDVQSQTETSNKQLGSSGRKEQAAGSMLRSRSRNLSFTSQIGGISPSSRLATSVQAGFTNARKQPLLLLGVPICVFIIFTALGIYGVMAGADKATKDKRAVVRGAALDFAGSFQLSFEQIFTPLVTLASFIKRQPNFPSFNRNFLSIAEDVVASVSPGSIQEIQISPFGVVRAVWPTTSAVAVARLGIDIFTAAALRGGAIATIERRDILLNGPLILSAGQDLPAFTGAIVRLPIFMENSSLSETFGTDRNLPTNCTSLCFNATSGEKFWGFVTIILLLGELSNGTDRRLSLLKQKKYRWAMTRPWTSTEVRSQSGDAFMFSNSSRLPEDPVSVEVQISNAVWTIYLSPEDGWRPSWQGGMIALVVLGSTMVSVLVAIIMASWVKQAQLLADFLTSNKQLAASTANLEKEKLRLDALLVRQYNLLAVLGGPGPKGAGSVGNGSSGSRGESLTLEHIEALRRQLAVNVNSSSADIESIQTIELLGEGTFGKVYKGLWRGSVVAVKTMVMPANMSGAEKREKMAVMEAAISSSLSHPNIVQTYTYAIRPIKDKTQDMMEGLQAGLLVRADGTSTSAGPTAEISLESTNTQSNVHSYEVRLVLEYCNKGSLRDALNKGALVGVSGRNYRAILDLSLDVAKAMLHLHSVNVLHGDLKACNVMLQSGGESGSLIAKVADFGLAVKMDAMETHVSSMFQGTMTHMAPEILMEGRVSKAVDVYAFGITLWEIYTAGKAFKGIPRALLGYQVSQEALRPRWPDDAPAGLRSLAERCWHHMPERRPQFPAILSELLVLRAAEPGVTPPVHVEGPVAFVSKQEAFQKLKSGGGGIGGSGSGGGGGGDKEDASISMVHSTMSSYGGGNGYGASEASASGWGSEGMTNTEGGMSTSLGMAGGGGGGGRATVRQRPVVLPSIEETQEEKAAAIAAANLAIAGRSSQGQRHSNSRHSDSKMRRG